MRARYARRRYRDGARTGPRAAAGTVEQPMMNHRTMQGFRRDDALRGAARRTGQTLRRVLTWIRPYRRLLIGFVVAVVVDAIVDGDPAAARAGASSTTRCPDKNRHLVAGARAGRGRARVRQRDALARAALLLGAGRRGPHLRPARRSCSTTCSGCRSRSSPARRPARCSRGSTTTSSARSRRSRRRSAPSCRTSSARGRAHDHVQARVAAHAADAASCCPRSSIPARRLGPRMQKLTREGMQLNAEMNNLTAERFNVAGALLAKLFGRPDARTRRVRDARARGVRDIGVTHRDLQPGPVRRARPRRRGRHRGRLLRRRQPRDLGHDHDRHRRRVRASTSGRSTNRSRSSRTRASTSSPRSCRSSACSRCSTSPPRSPTGPARSTSSSPKGRVEFDHVWFRHPPGARGLARVAGDARHARRRRAERMDPARRVARGRAGRDGRARRAVGRGQDDDRDARAARLRGRRRARCASTATTCATSRSSRCTRRSGSCRRTRTSSTTRSAPTCCSPRPDATDAELDRRVAARRASGISSRRCPTGSTPSSASAATACRAARSNASRSRGCCSRTRRS